jgi:hypothetical protein
MTLTALACLRHQINRLCKRTLLIFCTLLIGAEGAKTPVGVWFRGDPAGASAEEARRNTHEPLAPGEEINRQL